MIRDHIMTERRSPVAFLLRCSCGWSRQITRRQNALARAAKIRAAWNEHEREIDKEIENDVHD